jgi:hypothetical protein
MEAKTTLLVSKPEALNMPWLTNQLVPSSLVASPPVTRSKTQRCGRAGLFAISSVYLPTLAVQRPFAPVNNCSTHPRSSFHRGGDEQGMQAAKIASASSVLTITKGRKPSI